jgi:hypothetical protein
LLADRFGFVFLLEAREASAIKRLVALHHHLGEGVGVVEHVADLRVGAAKLPLRVTFDIKGADLNDPPRLGARCAAKKRFVSSAAASSACGTTSVAAAEGMTVGLDADACALGTIAATGSGSVIAATGLIGAAGRAALFGDVARALSGSAAGAGSPGPTITGPRPEVLICVLLSIDVAANPSLSSSRQRSRAFSRSASKASLTVRRSVQLGETSGTTCAIAHTFLENPK